MSIHGGVGVGGEGLVRVVVVVAMAGRQAFIIR